MEVFSLWAKLGLDKTGFDTGINNSENKMASFGKKAGGLLGKVASVGVAVGSTFAAGATAIGISSVKMAADFEQTEVAFSTLLGSSEAAQTKLEELSDFAANTPLEFPELAKASRSLLAFGVDAKDLIPTLQAVGDVSSGISAPIGEIAEIYGKAKVQGRLFMEDINQLTGRGIPIIQELAKQFGVTEAEVKSLVSNGEVSFDNLEIAFQDLTSEGGKFANMMEAQSQTLTGLWSTFTDNLGIQLRGIGTRLIETFDLKGKLKLAIAAIQTYTPLIEASLNSFFTWVGKVATGVGDFISNAKVWFENNQESIRLWATTAQTYFNNLKVRATDLFNALVNLWNNVLKPAWTAIAPFMNGLFTGMGTLITTFLGVVTSSINLLVAIFNGDWKTAWTSAQDIVIGIFNGLRTALIEVGGNLIGGLISGLTAGMTGLNEKVTGVANDVLNKFKEVWQIFSPSKAMWAIVDDLLAGGEKSLDENKKLEEAAKNAAARVVQAVKLGFLPASEAITDIAPKMDEVADKMKLAFESQDWNEFDRLLTIYNNLDALLDSITPKAEKVKENLLMKSAEEARAERAKQNRIDAQSELDMGNAYPSTAGFKEGRAEAARQEATVAKLRAESAANIAAMQRENEQRKLAFELRLQELEAQRQASSVAAAELEQSIREAQAERAVEAQNTIAAIQEEQAAERAELEAFLNEQAAQRAALEASQQAALEERKKESFEVLQSIRLEQEKERAELEAFLDSELAKRQAERAESEQAALEKEQSIRQAQAQREVEAADAIRAIKAEQEQERRDLEAYLNEQQRLRLEAEYEAYLLTQARSNANQASQDLDDGSLPSTVNPATGKPYTRSEIVDTKLSKEQEERQKLIDGLMVMNADDGPFKSMGKSLLNLAVEKIPLAGSAIQGFVQGGPMGALIAVFTELVGETTVFKDLIALVGEVIKPVIDIINVSLQPAFAILSPALKAIAYVMRGVSVVVAGIWNAIAGAINWALGWLGVNLQTIDIAEMLGIDNLEFGKDNDGSTDPPDSSTPPPKKPKEPIEFGGFDNNSSTSSLPSGATGIRVAAIGVTEQVLRDIAAEYELPQVQLQTQMLEALQDDFGADVFKEGAELWHGDALRMESFMSGVLDKLERLDSMVRGNDKYNDLVGI